MLPRSSVPPALPRRSDGRTSRAAQPPSTRWPSVAPRRSRLRPGATDEKSAPGPHRLKPAKRSSFRQGWRAANFCRRKRDGGPLPLSVPPALGRRSDGQPSRAAKPPSSRTAVGRARHPRHGARHFGPAPLLGLHGLGTERSRCSPHREQRRRGRHSPLCRTQRPGSLPAGRTPQLHSEARAMDPGLSSGHREHPGALYSGCLCRALPPAGPIPAAQPPATTTKWSRQGI